MSNTRRSQKFIPFLDWLSGERESELYDFSKIDKIPMEFFVHTEDEACPFDSALELQKEISSPVNIRIFTKPQLPIPPFSHTFATGRHVDRYFFYQLKEALTPGVDCGPFGWSCLSYHQYL